MRYSKSIVGYVACIEKTRNSYKILAAKTARETLQLL
jgi:hypothetical protein